VLRKHSGAIGYSINDVKGLNHSICMHHIFLNESYKASRQPSRHLNPNMQEVMKKEVVKRLDAEITYHILDNEWVSPV